MRKPIVLICFIALSSCDTKSEATFVIKNKDQESMMNTHVIVHIDSSTSYVSEKVDIPGKSQAVITIQIPDEPYHQGYEFGYTRNGKEIKENHSQWTKDTPKTESFMIEQLLDTLWFNTFHVN